MEMEAEEADLEVYFGKRGIDEGDRDRDPSLRHVGDAWSVVVALCGGGTAVIRS